MSRRRRRRRSLRCRSWSLDPHGLKRDAIACSRHMKGYCLASGPLKKAPRGTLDLEAAKEQLSRAYVQAIIAAARCMWARPEPDYDKVDLTIRQRANHLYYSQAILDVQLKATAQDVTRADHIAFRLPIEDYDALREEEVYNQRILVVVTLPSDPESWATWSSDGLLIKHCAYWVSLRGRGPAKAKKKTTVRIPIEQRFDVEGLCRLLKVVGDRGVI